MFSTGLTTRGCGGLAVVALRGELDLADAGAIVAVPARDPAILVDLAGLEFICSSSAVAL